jgi:hypothetical protein
MGEGRKVVQRAARRFENLKILEAANVKRNEKYAIAASTVAE